MFEHQLSTTPVNFEAATHSNTQVNQAIDIETFLKKRMNMDQLHYVMANHGQFQALMNYNIDYIPQSQTVIAIDIINSYLITAIKLLYRIPNEFRNDLIDLIASCAGYINVCDQH